MTELLKIDYLFQDYRRFPWDVMGLTIPKVGPLHSYLTSMLADWAPHGFADFMKNHPSWSELQRAARATEEGVLKDIEAYCLMIYSLPHFDRTDVAQEVLDFLYTFHPFKDHVQKTLDRLYRQGLISVPATVKPEAKR